MSDPFYFAFDTQGMQGRILCHAVMFSSFEVADDNKELKLCSLDRDPRMVRFVKFVRENWGTKKLVETSMALESNINRMKKEIDALEVKIAALKTSLQELPNPKT